MRLLGGVWSPEDLVAIVGAGWRGEPAQADALAALLRLAIPSHQHLGLGHAWELAVACLASTEGPLGAADAEQLVSRAQKVAARRSEGWRRPRRQRTRKGRMVECPAGDLRWLVA